MKCERCGKDVETVVSFSTEWEKETPAACTRCLKRAGLNIVASVKRMAATAKVQTERERLAGKGKA